MVALTIHGETAAYERWLAQHVCLVPEDLTFKHERMGSGAFAFMRATYYRWARLWTELCGELGAAPAVLSVGDVHVENFGTWRDAEGRLVWGVNDFDECLPLPWTHDLVRLATSAHLAIVAQRLRVRRPDACRAILEGYTRSLREGGRPFVLAERHRWLRKLALASLRPPARFWKRLEQLPDVVRPVPAIALAELRAALPAPDLAFRVVHRRAGLGSLGRQRFVAIAAWGGSMIAREAKALSPSVAGFCAGNSAPAPGPAALLASAVRVPDPCLRIGERWIVRRLAPDCARVELADLPEGRDEARLLDAMGYELGNLHLGTEGARRVVLADLERRDSGWLHRAVRPFAVRVASECAAWRSVRTPE